MQSFDNKRFHSFRADANALGGFLKEPLDKHIPTLAPVSLSAAGGFATARSGAFNLDEVVSCASAYTLVTGRESESGESQSEGSISTLTTAVVEDLNILEVVTAERIVAQIAVTIPNGKGPRRISLAGSRFEGLRLAGRDCVPKLNLALHQPIGNGGHELPLTWGTIRRAGQSQADKLMGWFEGRGKGAFEWAKSRHGWMTTSASQLEEGDPLLCSLVDGFEGSESNGHCGHIVEIPGFGRIILGELRVSRDSVQLVSIRAELGCPIRGVVTGPTPAMSGGGGQGNAD
jgi:hypothetical protein